MKTSVIGAFNMLGLAKRTDAKILQASTSEIYGKNTSDALGEEDDRILGSPLKVRWSYSEAKAIEEVLAYSYWHSEGLPARIVRLFNTVGPRQVGFYGMVVPRFVEAALKNEPITVYGDGTQTRCFAHVSDVIDALLKVAGTDKTIGTVVNIGNNFEISILDLAKKIIEITGSKSEITFVNYADAYEAGFEDMQRRVPSTQRLVSLTGWKVTKSLEEIIRDVAADLAK
jgi:UDP-glucose 4-epimerase